ncbi:M16 family metallopeptidase [Vulgatibacter sp.]|uniref:M16 family metallopeptidase n=1 Tax=Vulgatibacter sp. TaxID=1971226 RepID=UPI0035654897
MKSVLSAALLGITLPSVAFAAPAAAPAPAAASVDRAEQQLQIPYEKYKLDNGLEVILSKDDRLPVVAVNIWYHVGAFHEDPSRTGFAHLFEHMMFQGSKNVPDDVHIGLLEKIGATALNGTTNFDRTNYFETVPSHHLETALWLESDRMGFLLDAVTPESLKTQQEVVKNERRQSTETAPYGLADEKAWQALFPAPHPYYGAVIGSMEHLDAATMDDVQNFFRTWYAPANATLAIVGDFDEKQVRQLVEKYFGSLPSAQKPSAPAVEKVQLDREVVIRHDETVASLPKLSVAWHAPAFFAKGDATADILAMALSSGKASRLYKTLVFDKRLAQSVSAYQQSLGAQSVFTIEAIARPGVSTDKLLAEIDRILADVRKKGVTEEEIQRARNKFETGKVAGLQSVGGFGGKADLLQSYNHFLGTPDKLAFDLARYDTVTSDMVKQFATEVLDERRVVLHAVPTQGGTVAAKGAR